MIKVPLLIFIWASDFIAEQCDGSKPLPEAVRTDAPEIVMLNVPLEIVTFPLAEIPLEAFPETFKLKVPPVIVIVFVPVFIAFTSVAVEVTFIVPPEIATAPFPASIPSPPDAETVNIPLLIVNPSLCKPSVVAEVTVVVPF